ncbi:hypothetical protein [Chitinophaga pinensis]|uniref:hypothetical protein n=1 Tax=Chitinophaga pinensis TaxID=79329 RepID=UPI001C991A4C|nr:hypothetical protein [Chitinophaga pinensis]
MKDGKTLLHWRLIFAPLLFKEKKTIKHIPAAYLNMLTGYHWPGNIRELENIIARSVLLSTDDEFMVILFVARYRRMTGKVNPPH